MDQGHRFIRPHQVMTCSGCHTLSEFIEDVYEADLPALLGCPNCNWKYRLSHETRRGFALPKRDPRIGVTSRWIVEKRVDQQSGDDVHSAIEQEINNLPPELRSRSVHDRLDEMASMMLSLKRMQHSIIRDFTTVCEAFTEEVNSAISPYDYLRGAINAEALATFFERPFFVLPIDFATHPLCKLGRLIASPSFYRRVHGIPIGNGCGFFLQLICPYSDLDDPAPPFLRKMLNLSEPPLLEVIGKKVVGKQLPYLWKDIPGIIEDVDHSDNHPSVRMEEDTAPFRRWAVQYGVRCWTPPSIRETFYDGRVAWIKEKFPKLYPPLVKLMQKGRLLYCHRERDQRLKMMGAAVQALQAKAILIHPVGIPFRWDEYGLLRGDLAIQKAVVPMDYQEFLRGDYVNQAELICVEADQPFFRDIAHLLYQHERRLLLLCNDPLLDALEANDAASELYSLVSSVHYSRGSFLGPNVWRRDEGAVLNQNLYNALRKAGFLEPGS